MAKHLLGHERLNTGRIGICKRLLAQLNERAAVSTDGYGGRLIDDPRFGDRLARVEIELMALEITNLRFLDALRGGRPLGVEVSMLQIRSTELQQNLHELAIQTAGPLAAPRHAVCPAPADSGAFTAVAFDQARLHLAAN